MKTIRAIPSVALVLLSLLSNPATAEDIDIYSGLGSTGNVPNVMIVLDNAANFSSSASGASCVIDGVATALSGSVGGIEQ
jgi:type IV pilus assembly protein PilY1